MRLRALLFLPLVLGAAGACASIWGFDDATPADAADSGPIVDTEVVPAQGAVGIVCVPRGPGDWLGPLVIAETTGSPAPAPPECPAGYERALEGHADRLVGSCDCRCGAPGGGACSSPPAVTIFSTYGDCTVGTSACRTLPVTSACAAYPDAGCPATNTFARVNPAAPTGGSCAAITPSAPSVPSWQAAVRACAAPVGVPGTCPAGKVPTPQAALPYQTNYCVAVTGTAACPATYPKQRVSYTGAKDSRSCTCACGAPDGGTCAAAKITGRDHVDCTGTTVAPTSSCTAMGNTSAIVLDDPGAPSGGGCAPLATMAGELLVADPITICCRR